MVWQVGGWGGGWACDFYTLFFVSVQSSTSGFLSSSKLQGLSQGLGGGKKRVAHLPKLASATVASKTKASFAKGENKSTHVTTASKTEKRVAHAPNLVRN